MTQTRGKQKEQVYFDLDSILSQTPVFAKMFDPRYENDWEYGFFDGGRGSGKSFVPGAVYGLYRMWTDWWNHGFTHNILETRQVGGKLDNSNKKMYETIISLLGLSSFFTIKHNEIRFNPSGGVISFVGLNDDASEVKSMVGYTLGHVEEANNLKGNQALAFSNLSGTIFRDNPQNIGKHKCPHKIIITFNPLANSQWLYDMFEVPVYMGGKVLPSRRKDVLRIHSTYRDNLSLTQENIDRLLSTIPLELRDSYADGKMSIFEESVFKNYEIQELSKDVTDYDDYAIRGGVDFSRGGSDPTVCVLSATDVETKTKYIIKAEYKYGLSAIEQLNFIKQFFQGTDFLIYLDHDVDKITDLINSGLNCSLAYKKQKQEWVLYVNDYKTIIDKDCEEFASEVKSLSYLKNKQTGQISDNISGYNDHGPDAWRYSDTDLFRYRPMKSIGIGGYSW